LPINLTIHVVVFAEMTLIDCLICLKILYSLWIFDADLKLNSLIGVLISIYLSRIAIQTSGDVGKYHLHTDHLACMTNSADTHLPVQTNAYRYLFKIQLHIQIHKGDYLSSVSNFRKQIILTVALGTVHNTERWHL
jgi:hypothetical protein